MTKKIGILIVTILGGALLVYSATRSLDFIELTLPADRQILAYFGLAALDGGIIAWLLSYLYGSRGGWQRAISVLMLIVDVIGAIAMFTLDTLYNTGKNGMTTQMTPETITNAVLALSAIIALNIIATIAHHVTEPDKLREQAEEEAFSKVEEAALKQISKNADQLAAKLAPTMAADWMQQTEARYMSYVGTGKMPTIDATAQNVPLPVMLPDNQKPTINLAQFLPAWLMTKFSGRKFESAVTSHIDNLDVAPKANSLHEAMKQGIAEAQGVKPEDLHSAVDGLARVLSQEPTEYQAPTPKPREGLHFPMWGNEPHYHPVGFEPIKSHKDLSNSEMFVYKCPSCGWELKSPEVFTTKKPCLNCDGFIELQSNGGDKAEANPAPFVDNEPKPE